MQRAVHKRVSPPVAPDVFSPWRMSDEHDRAALLQWFLNTDLRTEDAVRHLCRLTGRVGPRPITSLSSRARLPRGAERGRHARAAASVPELIAAYRRLQTELRMVHRIWAGVTNGLRPGSDPVRTLVWLRGEAFLRSDLGLSAHLDTSSGARRFLSMEVRSAVPLIFRLLEDRRYTLGDGTEPLRLPLSPELATMSLAAELALALLHEFTEKRASGVCAVCGNAWLRADTRGRPKLCESDICTLEWRRRRRKPEPPGASTRRSRKFRMRPALPRVPRTTQRD